MKKRIIDYSNGLDLSIWMMKMEILIHELLHIFEKLVLMLTVFYLKKFIMKVSVKTRETHFSPLLLPGVTSRPSFDSSAEHSSKHSFVGTLTTGYDSSRREGTNDGSDTGNDGGDIADRQISQYSLSSFTGEDDFTHATQDEDHGSRRAGPGIGAIGNPYRGRQRRMAHHNEDSLLASFESMSIGTQYNDSSNDGNIFPPNTMSYGQPSSNPLTSIDEEYGMINYPHAEQMSFHIPYQMQQGFQTNMWVNPEFPIHGEVVGTSQDIYAWHVRSYNQYYRNIMSWYDYCLHQDGIPSSNVAMEPQRSSFWW